MQPQILVPLDGSPLAETALPHAIRLAQTTGRDLALLRVVDHLTGNPLIWGHSGSHLIQEDFDQVHAEARQYLARVAAQLQPQALAVHPHIAVGAPVPTILHWSMAERGVTTIVMATHGRGGLSRWLFGSVTAQVIRSAPVPLLIVPPGCHAAAAAVRAAGPYARILVPLDGSLCAAAALEEAYSLAAAAHAQIVLVGVVRRADPWYRADAAIQPLWIPEAEEQEAAALSRYLTEQVQHCAAQAIPAVAHLAHGEPAAEILRAAAQGQADLLIMATHSRPWLEQVVLGSVAQAVVQRASTPVMLIRPPLGRDTGARVPADQMVEVPV